MASIDPHMIDDEDLEDGEIETDEENDNGKQAVADIDDAIIEPKKIKSDDETKSKANDVKVAKNDRSKQVTAKSTNSNSKKSTANDNASKKPPEDDWMGDVENAIAMALKKDGIEPKALKVSSGSSKASFKDVKEDKLKEAKEPKEVREKEPKEKEPKEKESKSSKRRKRKSEKESGKKRLKLTDDDDKPYHSDASEDFDEFEMMNVRGGSPPSHGGPSSKQRMAYYDSDASLSSYDSYESIEHRSRRHRSKRHGNERSSRRSGHRSSKREKRNRRDDSDDSENIGSNMHHPHNHSNNQSNNSGNNRNNNNNQPRKPELCKFYLMECCAKGEKCLYMHGDFPCKFYYLGMSKSHNRETCKFSHGKPLSEQMRQLLLKHLETAPKEILGDFPRIPRESAINMLNAQHQKLLVKFGMEPDPSMNPTVSGQSSKLPSLLELNFSKPTNVDLAMALKAKDKPRKSRWCDQRSMESNSMAGVGAASASAQAPANEHDIKLSSLTGTLTPEQVEKLAKMGIETISQVTQLTVLQVIELGLSIALISELQLKAVQLQQAKAKAQSAAGASISSEKKNPFSTSSKEAVSNQDQDMRFALNSSSANDRRTDNALLNQDVDMRILSMPPQQSAAEKSKHRKRENSHGDRDEQLTSKQSSERDAKVQKLSIDYSQYLKDANIDLNQSDLEEPLGEHLSKEKKKSYDSDEDEANPLVIEEDEGLHIDESHDSDVDERVKSSANNDDSFDVDRDIDMETNKLGDDENASNAASSPNSNSNPANASDEAILPAFYAPSSIFPTSVTNKIDLSSSVSQYLKKETLAKETVKKTDSYVTQHENEAAASASASASDAVNDNDSIGSGSPSTRTTSKHFEFFSRQIPETNHPAPQALDDKPSPTVDYDSGSELSLRANNSPVPVKPARKSIYEWSSDDEANDDDSHNNVGLPSDDENDDSQDSRKQNTFASKDKDMRLSSLFMDKDYSNGDIDLRLPFKPVMANYIPATEIDASITSHAPISYAVRVVDVPKPDYSELRKSIPGHENLLDPRLRRILRIKDDQVESESAFSLSIKSSPFSPPHEIESTPPNPFLTTSSSTSTSSSSSAPALVKADAAAPRTDPRRADPRRPNAAVANTTSNSTLSPVLTQQSTAQRSLHLDIQNILQKSQWYKDCSSKQKIMVNQQLAIVSTELKKFHADPSENKIFDLKFIIQNQLLQEVLTNLGIFISEDGEFVQLDQSAPKDTSRSGGGGLVDLMSLPISNNMDLNDYLRNQQQQVAQQQQQQQALQQAMSAMGNPRFLGVTPSASLIPGFAGLPDIRPGLLGIAPNLPIGDAAKMSNEMFQFALQNSAAAAQAQFFNRGGGTGNANSGDNRNNYRGVNVGAGNNRRDVRRFDRNNARRDKK